MTEKVVSPKIYIWTCVALLVLLAVTRSIAYVNLGPCNLIVALAVSITKAIIIALFFMQIKGSSRLLHFGCGRWRDVAADPDLPHAQRLFYPRLGSVESLSVLAVVLSSFAELSSAPPLGLERNDARVARWWVLPRCSR